MNRLTLDAPVPQSGSPTWRDHTFAGGLALALHAGLALVLLQLAQEAPMAPAVAAVIKTQLVTLPAPTVQAPVPPPPPAIPDVPTPVQPAPMQAAPEPIVERKSVERADLALKRVEEAQREEERRVKREQRLEAERQRREKAEQRQQELAAREAAQREAQIQQEQRAAQQAEAQRQAALAAARAEAEAASRQYLPIAKEAPDYPQKALDRGIEGECTVTYTVTASGRVENPEIAGNCHPLFVRPSIAAAKSFRYQPKVVNGQAVAVANVKNTFSYRIQ
jgi:periplasmic protein TonB